MAAAPDSFTHVAEEVRTRVANWLRVAHAPLVQTGEDTASEDKLEACARRKQELKSGKIQTVDTLVTRTIPDNIKWFTTVSATRLSTMT